MVLRGAKTLVLVGRRPADERAERACRRLEELGARVVVYQADVAQHGQVERLLSNITTTLPPLRGVIHAAGVLDDGMLRQLSWERFARVMQPKMAGAWDLHRLTAGTELDFFVLFSSFTSILGSPGQANHAAANAFLDALACHRRARGLPALSLNWGAWSDIGAAAERQVGERIKMKGGGTLSPEQGLRLLEEVWHTAVAQVAIVPIHWSQLDEQLMRRPLLADFVPMRGAPPSRPSDLLGRFRSAAPHKRRALLVDHICAEVAKVLGLQGGDAMEPQQGFFERGMDSLTSVELRNRLRASLQCELPTTVAFDHPTPDALADFVLGRLDRPREASSPAPGLPVEPVGQRWETANLNELSVAELETLIDEELDELADPIG
jgi:microcystin synthetase protein McyG